MSDEHNNPDDLHVAETAIKYEPIRGPVPGKRYTYSDYITWGEDLDNGPDYKEVKKRWELIDGVPYVMAGPNTSHQRILGRLYNKLYNFLEGKPCEVFVAPYDVRINADGADNTVVQPDILVVCEADLRSKAEITKAGINGAPDMVIEILSPSNRLHDKERKLRVYESYGVREYWIVDPEAKTVAVHLPENGRYYIKAYSEKDIVPVSILDGCNIDLSGVFAE